MVCAPDADHRSHKGTHELLPWGGGVAVQTYSPPIGTHAWNTSPLRVLLKRVEASWAIDATARLLHPTEGVATLSAIGCGVDQGMRRWKRWQILLGIVTAVAILIAGDLAVIDWRERHETLAEQARLRLTACNPTSAAALDSSLRIIGARLEGMKVYSYHFSRPDPCTVLLDLPERPHLAFSVGELTSRGNLVLYGMGSLPQLREGARMVRSSNRPCEAPPPCVILTGDDLDRSATGVSKDPYGQPEVSFAATALGAARLADYTQAHLGQHLAIVLDGRVVTDPTIQSALFGSGIINNLSEDEADRFASILRHLELPVTLTLVSLRPLAGHG